MGEYMTPSRDEKKSFSLESGPRSQRTPSLVLPLGVVGGARGTSRYQRFLGKQAATMDAAWL
jgi:hypothetical protein